MGESGSHSATEWVFFFPDAVTSNIPELEPGGLGLADGLWQVPVDSRLAVGLGVGEMRCNWLPTGRR